MRLKIRVKLLDGQQMPHIIEKGDWIDLRANQTVVLKGPMASVLHKKKVEDGVERAREVHFETTLIPLGVAMKLPDGFEAIVEPRSSIFKNFKIMLLNSMGIIDNSYSGNTDEWKFGAIALENTTINKGDRICQFRIQLSQRATFKQKLAWLFSSGIELVEVDNLDDVSRGGIGTTGKA